MKLFRGENRRERRLYHLLGADKIKLKKKKIFQMNDGVWNFFDRVKNGVLLFISVHMS